METFLVVLGVVTWLIGIILVVRSAFQKRGITDETPVQLSTSEKQAQWNWRIDDRCERFSLDPALPEIQDLRAAIAQYADDESRHGMIDMLVTHVDPSFEVEHRDGVMQLHEGWILKRILKPWTLIGYFYPSMPVTKLVVSNLGMTIYSGDRVIAWVEAAVVDPHRFDDDHRRLQNTITIVKHYAPTMDIEAGSLVGVYSAVFFKNGNEWSHHLSYAPETANIS